MTNPHIPAFIYVDTDIPAGMTIREWRRSRTPRYRRSLLDRLFRLPGRRVEMV
jgi:hypothetical protein